MPSKKQEAEQVQSKDDTIIDHDTGLVLRADPFGGDSPDVLGVFDPSEWEVLEEDFGPIIDWNTSPIVAGWPRNQKVVMIDHDDERGQMPTNLYSLEDAVTHERRAFYGNFQLDNALGCPNPEQGQKTPYMNRLIAIKWIGKRDQAGGRRTLNIYTVLAKREPVEVKEPVQESAEESF